MGHRPDWIKVERDLEERIGSIPASTLTWDTRVQSKLALAC